MFENQAKTLSFKTNEEVSNAFEKLEARIRETDSTITRGDVLATVIDAAEKVLVTEDNIKLATKEELRLIDQHTQRLKDIYLSIFKRSEDHQAISTNKIRDLEAHILELKNSLKIETENFKTEMTNINIEKDSLLKENEEISEKSRMIENSFLDKERTIKSLEEKIRELEEIRIENRELAIENKNLIARNNEVNNEKINIENELKHREIINDRLEKEGSEKALEIKELNSKIQDIINEKEKEKALEIKAINNEYKKELDSLNNEHRKEIDILKDEYNMKIQEVNKNLTALEIELEIIRSREEKKAKNQEEKEDE